MCGDEYNNSRFMADRVIEVGTVRGISAFARKGFFSPITAARTWALAPPPPPTPCSMTHHDPPLDPTLTKKRQHRRWWWWRRRRRGQRQSGSNCNWTRSQSGQQQRGVPGEAPRGPTEHHHPGLLHRSVLQTKGLGEPGSARRAPREWCTAAYVKQSTLRACQAGTANKAHGNPARRRGRRSSVGTQPAKCDKA